MLLSEASAHFCTVRPCRKQSTRKADGYLADCCMVRLFCVNMAADHCCLFCRNSNSTDTYRFEKHHSQLYGWPGVLVPPLQVKLGLTKQSVKAQCQDDISLEFLGVSFLQVTYYKSESVVLVSLETKRNT